MAAAPNEQTQDSKDLAMFSVFKGLSSPEGRDLLYILRMGVLIGAGVTMAWCMEWLMRVIG